MKDVGFLGLTIKLDGNRDWSKDYDLGSLTLSRDGREYIVDVCGSTTLDGKGECEIECELEVDKDIFEDCPFDLTVEDLMSNDLTAEFYLQGTFENIVESISLAVSIGDMTKMIDVNQE